MSKPTPINELFWSRVNVGKTVLCWEWRGCRDKHGYGQFSVARKITRSHRVAFWLRNGFWPKVACHRCNNPTCCNPDHIYDGTPLTNASDRELSGRGRRLMGEAQWQSRLTDAQAIEVRRIYSKGGKSIESLASDFDVGRSTIQRIVSGKSYRHLLFT